jgi:hypothetical protein
VKTPSVTTLIRVFGPDFETIRARDPIRSPTASEKECAMRSAAARAAMRRACATNFCSAIKRSFHQQGQLLGKHKKAAEAWAGKRVDGLRFAGSIHTSSTTAVADRLPLWATS